MEEKKHIPWVRIILIVLLAGVGIYLGIVLFKETPRAKMNPDREKYQQLLGREERNVWENREWTPNEAYLQLNQRILVSGKEAEIRLINPPYCGYDLGVQIKRKNTEEMLYEIEKISPGTLLEDIELQQKLVKGEHEATVYFTFYDGKGNQQGERELEVVFVVE